MESDCDLDALIEDTLLDLQNCGATCAPTLTCLSTDVHRRVLDNCGSSPVASKSQLTPQEASSQTDSGDGSRKLNSEKPILAEHQEASSAATSPNSTSTAEDDTVCVVPSPEVRKRVNENATENCLSWKGGSNRTSTLEQCDETRLDNLEAKGEISGSSSTQQDADPLAFCLKELESELAELQNAPAPRTVQDQCSNAIGEGEGGLLQLLQTLSRVLEASGSDSGSGDGRVTKTAPQTEEDVKERVEDHSLSGVDNLLETLEQEMPLQAIAQPLQQLLAVYEPWLCRQKRTYRAQCEGHDNQKNEGQNVDVVAPVNAEEIRRCEKQIAAYKRIVELCSPQNKGSKDHPQVSAASDAAERGLSKLLRVQELLEDASAYGDPPRDVLHALNELDSSISRTDAAETEHKHSEASSSLPQSNKDVQKPLKPSSLDSAVGGKKNAGSNDAPLHDELLNESDLKDFVGFVGILQQAAAEEGVDLLDPQLLQQVLTSGDTTDLKIERLLDRVEMHQRQQKGPVNAPQRG